MADAPKTHTVTLGDDVFEWRKVFDHCDDWSCRFGGELFAMCRMKQGKFFVPMQSTVKMAGGPVIGEAYRLHDASLLIQGYLSERHLDGEE
jgi:hypothetical protein